MATRWMQPGEKVLDWAWGRPTMEEVRANQYTGVIRYIGWTPQPTDDLDKIVSIAEFTGLINNGMAVALVFETTASRAGDGAVAGDVDGRLAVQQAHVLSYKDAVIFCAVDYDAQYAAVKPYIDAFCAQVEMAGFASGVYGGFNVVRFCEGIYRWQTEAWSYGQVDEGAHLLQRIAKDIPNTDRNEVLKPIPFFALTGSPSNPPAIQTYNGDVMYLVQLFNRNSDGTIAADQEGRPVVLSDGWKSRKLLDDGTELAFLQSIGLPMFVVTDEWVDIQYRQQAGIA